MRSAPTISLRPTAIGCRRAISDDRPLLDVSLLRINLIIRRYDALGNVSPGMMRA